MVPILSTSTTFDRIFIMNNYLFYQCSCAGKECASKFGRSWTLICSNQVLTACGLHCLIIIFNGSWGCPLIAGERKTVAYSSRHAHTVYCVPVLDKATPTPTIVYIYKQERVLQKWSSHGRCGRTIRAVPVQYEAK